MAQYDLIFYGYTWDEYTHVIYNKGGVLLVYNGCLDGDGVVQMKEILFIDYAKNFEDSFCSESFRLLRTELEPGSMLFYSYSPALGADGELIKEELIHYITPRFNKRISSNHNLELHCKGACALFPSHFI